MPEVLGAVNRAVDDRWAPGRFLLTGSVRARSTTATWPGTGRVVTLPLFGLSMAERVGNAGEAPFFDRLVTGTESLLSDLFLIERIPAWHSNRLERLTSQPKRVMLDAGFVGAAAGVDRGAVLADGHLLGRTPETFVISELRAELPIAQGSPRLFHLRDDGARHEVDDHVEFDDGRVGALEIKATSASTRTDAKHLYWLKLGDRLAVAAGFLVAILCRLPRKIATRTSAAAANFADLGISTCPVRVCSCNTWTDMPAATMD